MYSPLSSAKQAVLLCATVLLVGCASSGLKPFSSDGCSLFPDRALIGKADWCECCELHDMAYWRGGTAQQREAADKALRDCVLKKTNNKVLAETMYEGVRVGGSPYFYTWYRWGYGWSYGRDYQPLTLEEMANAERQVKEYLELDQNRPCKRMDKGPSFGEVGFHRQDPPCS